MADSIFRLRVDSKEYDSKIKRAAEGVRAFGESCRKAGTSVNSADEDTLRFVRDIGKMGTVNKTAKGSINEMSKAFLDLSMEYQKLSDQEKKGTFGQALGQSLDQLRQRTINAKQELEDLSRQLQTPKETALPTGGMTQGMGKLDGMLAVFGGNMMTKAASMASGLVTELTDAVKQGIELAKAGEGIRIAFDRLNRPDLLDKLREATHGTVTDLELMKQAVKFNDFNLSLDEMGTMLAFAQQKAKDTGQSVDYMVDSIVTGLGRKSLMILDNLGLSAAEIKDKMKDAGDMTKAVGAIIREQMQKAGDYVETAADRAAQANVSLQNKMEELGRKFAPVEEASNHLWTSMKIAILDVVGGPLASLLNGLTEAGRLKNALNSMNGEEGSGTSTKVGQQLKRLEAIRKAGGSNFVYDNTRKSIIDQYNRQIEERQLQIDETNKALKTNVGGISASKGIRSTLNDLIAQRDALKAMRDEFIAGAKELSKPVKVDLPTITTTGTTTPTKVGRVGTGGGGSTVEKTEAQLNTEQISKLNQEYITATDERKVAIRGEIKVLQERNAEIQRLIDESNGKTIEIPVGSLKDLNDQMTKLRQERDLLSDPIDIKVKDTEISDLQERIDELNGKKKELKQVVPVGLEYQIRESIAADVQEVDMNTLKSLLEVKIKNGLDSIEIPTETIQQAIFGEGLNIPDEYWQTLADNINAHLQALGLEPITLDVKTGNITDTAKQVGDSWRTAASAVQAVGGALQALEDPAAKVAGIVGQAIANIALGFAQATAKDSKLGVFGWIAAVAGGLGTMLSTISAIKSATAGSYAQGGIIPGNDYNDGLIANVSSGELILNRAQQDSIAGQLISSPVQGMQLEARIEGEDIILATRNANRRRGRGEYVTTKTI